MRFSEFALGLDAEKLLQRFPCEEDATVSVYVVEPDGEIGLGVAEAGCWNIDNVCGSI
jgi:hypothetical protein